VRLQAFLARSGVASRRASEELIAQGRVSVNGEVVTAPGTRIVPGTDVVALDGVEVRAAPAAWIALNKPRGYVTSRQDPFGRPTVYDLLPAHYHGLFHVGRLDRDSEGLLLLTNEGEAANRFLHPSFGVTKEYEVDAVGKLSNDAVRALTEGVELEDGIARAETVRRLGESGTGIFRLRMVLREGKKREVRRMLEALGHPVRRLVRRRFGPVELGDLRPGKWRMVGQRELEKPQPELETPKRGALRAAEEEATIEDVAREEDRPPRRGGGPRKRDEARAPARGGGTKRGATSRRGTSEKRGASAQRAPSAKRDPSEKRTPVDKRAAPVKRAPPDDRAPSERRGAPEKRERGPADEGPRRGSRGPAKKQAAGKPAGPRRRSGQPEPEPPHGRPHGPPRRKPKPGTGEPRGGGDDAAGGQDEPGGRPPPRPKPGPGGKPRPGGKYGPGGSGGKPGPGGKRGPGGGRPGGRGRPGGGGSPRGR
jgi:23S rRNA pseudouridine2605 synthase